MRIVLASSLALLAACATDTDPCELATGTWIVWSTPDVEHLPMTVEVVAGQPTELLARDGCPAAFAGPSCSVMVDRECGGVEESGSLHRWRRTRYSGDVVIDGVQTHVHAAHLSECGNPGACPEGL